MAIIEEIIQDKPVEADQDGDVFYDSTDYQTEELQQLLKEAAEYKSKGNTLFAQAEYKKAIEEYENALMTCPASQNKERAVYFGNIAACHLKLEAYKDARDMCTQSLQLDPHYLKALLRRAQANEKLGTSSALSDALTDYQKLSAMATDTYTLQACKRAQQTLPSRIQQKAEQEKEEMMSKLKDLGNTLLGKFGLSTDNFQFTPDAKGGYSMNFVNK